jgi:hypothetical protein
MHIVQTCTWLRQQRHAMIQQLNVGSSSNISVEDAWLRTICSADQISSSIACAAAVHMPMCYCKVRSSTGSLLLSFRQQLMFTELRQRCAARCSVASDVSESPVDVVASCGHTA